MTDPLAWLVPMLVCPVCRRPLRYEPDAVDPAQGLLLHGGNECEGVYPVIDGIPRLLVGAQRARLVRTRRAWFETPLRREVAVRWREAATANDEVVAGFDYEWSSFSRVGTPELGRLFELYFDLVPASAFEASHVVIDVGCGAGRWAYEVARRGPRVIAIDLGFSVDIARKNTAALGRVGCVQADVHHLPLAPGTADWAYSLGVLHHVAEPRRALNEIVKSVRRGGHVLLYLYYALDNRGALYRLCFHLADFLRRALSRSPRPVVYVAGLAFAAAVYLPLARLARVVESVGLSQLAEALPLSFYRHLPFYVMVNDSVDRFGTRVEFRYTKVQLRKLMGSVGLAQISISDAAPYWHAIGSKPIVSGKIIQQRRDGP